MTIVLISPKKFRKVFFIAIAVVFAVILLGVAGAVFLPVLTKQLGMPIREEIPTIPFVTIDFSSLDSSQVQELQPFAAVPMAFDYTAQDAAGKEVKGSISAATIADAQRSLQIQGLSVKNIEESARGRGEPFFPYYSTNLLAPEVKK